MSSTRKSHWIADFIPGISLILSGVFAIGVEVMMLIRYFVSFRNQAVESTFPALTIFGIGQLLLGSSAIFARRLNDIPLVDIPDATRSGMSERFLRSRWRRLVTTALGLTVLCVACRGPLYWVRGTGGIPDWAEPWYHLYSLPHSVLYAYGPEWLRALLRTYEDLWK